MRFSGGQFGFIVTKCADVQVELLGSLPFERSEIESKLKQSRRIISLKNAAEYEDRLIKQTEAHEMLKDAQRLVEWVENKLEK